MTNFPQFCDQLSRLDEAAAYDLFTNLKSSTLKEGDCLLKEGEVCKYLFFIENGLVKMFFNREDKEFIMRFFSENVLFTAFESYLTQSPSRYRIVALEPTTVTLVSYDRMEELCKKHHSIETFFRKLVSIATVKMTRRISEMLEENASNRYNQFIKENSLILQRISLGDLAKYMGITQQSLSRIRAQK